MQQDALKTEFKLGFKVWNVSVQSINNLKINIIRLSKGSNEL